MKALGFFVLGLLAFGVLAVARLPPSSASTPIVTPSLPPPTATIVTPVKPTAIAWPHPSQPALRVEFPRGSYGTTLTGSGSTRYLLWAAAGQQFNTNGTGIDDSRLIGADGNLLDSTSATLAATGDQMLEIRAAGAFTVAVDIR